DAMATVVAHHAGAVGVGMILDDLADIAQPGAGTHHRNTLVEAFLGNPGQAFDPLRHVAHMEHLAGVAVVAVLDDGDVDVHRIAVLQRLVVRNAVAGHMIERGADGFGEGDAPMAATVVQRSGNRLLHVHDVVVADAVQLVGGHAGLYVLFDHFQNFGGEATGHAHAGNVFSGLDGYAHVRRNLSCEYHAARACRMDLADRRVYQNVAWPAVSGRRPPGIPVFIWQGVVWYKAPRLNDRGVFPLQA